MKSTPISILRQARLKMSLSQKALSAKIGVSQQHIDRYEKGYPIPVARALKLADVLHIDKWDLLPQEIRPAKAGALDSILLERIIVALENVIQERSLTFQAPQKAHLIALLYEKFSVKPVNDNNIEEEISNIADKVVKSA